MTTNDEIKYRGGIDLAKNKSLESLIDKMLDEARADTAKQIFKKLNLICQDTETGLGVDLEDSLALHARDRLATHMKIRALKKEYKVD